MAERAGAWLTVNHSARSVHVIGHHHLRPDREFEPPNALVAVANHMCHTAGEIGALAGFEAVESAGLSDVTLRDLDHAAPDLTFIVDRPARARKHTPPIASDRIWDSLPLRRVIS